MKQRCIWIENLIVIKAIVVFQEDTSQMNSYAAFADMGSMFALIDSE